MVRGLGRRGMRAVLLAALCAFAVVSPVCAPSALAEAAANAALEISFSVKPEVLVGPGEASMTILLTNTTDRAIQNIYLTSSDGLLSEPVGQLGPGESQTLVRPHTVTAGELDAGQILYTITHDAAEPGGEKAVYTLTAPIARGEAEPRVDFTRQFSSAIVPRGGVLTITYRVVNTGNVALTSLRLRDSLGDFTGRLEQLDVGDSKTFISRVTVNEAASSAPVLEYVTPSGDTALRALEEALIPSAEGGLDASFSVGRSVFSEATADAILTLTNTGNAGFTGIVVEDDIYGGVIADAIDLPAGQGPVEVAFTYPLRGEASYRWRITGMSTAGEPLELVTDTLTVAPAPTGETVAITLEAVARTPRINRPGRVAFDFAITNNGDVMASEALLYEVNRGELRRLAVIPTGEPTVCAASYDVDEDAQFIFCLNYTDAQGRQRTVTTAPIDVVIVPDGVTPEFDDGDALRLEGGSVKPTGNSSSFYALLAIAGAALTVMFTILLVASLRARRERRARREAERQRIKEELGKTNPSTPVKRRRGKRKKKK